MCQFLQRRAAKASAIRRRGVENRGRIRRRWRIFEPLESRQLLAPAVDGAVVFNEVMYHPADGNEEMEWIELYNPAAIDVDISGWTLSGGVQMAFLSNTIVRARQYLVVAANPTALTAATGLTGLLGPYSGNLSNGGDKLDLLNNTGRLMDEVSYGDSGKWPAGADGSGASLAKSTPESDSGLAQNWVSSNEIGGTPAARNFPSGATAFTLAFNELAAGQPADFWLELMNCGSSPVALDGYVIVSSAGGQFVLPAQTLSAGQFLPLTQDQLGFGAAVGDKLFLITPDRRRLVDAIQVDNVLRGRSPEGTGAWLYPAAGTAGAANSFQFHSEVIINEIMYDHRPAWINAAIPPQDVPEQWIELYNRSDALVDVSGWRLDDAVNYEFPSGTTIAAHGYLVVSNNHAALQTAYPAVATIIGDFTGKLSHSSDHIVLRDANGNPDDEVTYYDGGNWPEYAAAGGSSLELRDPDADNSRPEAWSASDESARTSWRTYTYTVTAQSSVVGPDSQWTEFDLGMISNGMVLMDDISVKDMTNGGSELISNGNFEGGTNASAPRAPGAPAPPVSWRMLGNHCHSGVVIDPSNAANHVLKLVATGPAEHMDNHLETNVVSIVNSHTYQVSYKARWVDGSNQVNTRLYFDRAARTTLIDQSVLSGTPGSQNSTYAANIGPTYRNLKHSPVVPAAGSLVTVSVTAEDPDGLGALNLKYSVQGGTWISVAMTAKGGGLYQGTIPGQAASSVVQFYVDGGDSLGMHSYFPAGAASSGALYKVNDNLAATNGLHNFRIIMTPGNATWFGDSSNVMSNDPVPCTVIYDESQVYYDVGARTKASERGRLDPNRVAFFVYFNADQPFRGLHSSVGFDRSDGVGFGQREMLIKQAMGHYGSVGAEYSDLTQLIVPTNIVAAGPAEMQPTRFSNDYLDSQFANGSDGTLFNYDFIYYPVTTNAYGYKVAQPDGVVGTNFSALGSSGNLLSNSSFETWSGGVPTGWTVAIGGSNVSQVSTASDGGSALRITGDAAGTLTALTQTLSLSSAARVYLLSFRVRNDGTAPAGGSLAFSLVDGTGAVIQDGQGSDNLFSVSLAETTASYTTYMALFLTPGTLPPVVKLKISLGPALTSARSVYVDGLALSDLGNDKEQYRYSLITKNNRVADDFTRIIQFAKFWASTGKAFTDHISEYIDVDVWLRGFALGVLNGNGDNFVQGDQHNGLFYVRPSDQRVLFLPKDLDAFYNSAYGVANSGDLQKLLAVPAYNHAYYGYLYDIISTTWNTAYMGYWATNYGKLLPAQDFSGYLSFIGQRSSYVLGLINSAIPQVSYGVTTGGGSVPSRSTTVTGTGWVNVREIHLNGSNQAIPLTWTTSTAWQTTVPLAAGANLLNFQAYDFQGNLVGSKTITITSTVTPTPLEQYLRITELNYNPSSPTDAERALGITNNDDFEFVELTNTSTATTLADLRGLKFTSGVTFDFTASSSIFSMAPGDRIVLVKNPAAFRARYGTGLNSKIAGAYTGSLSNSGEHLTLAEGNGQPLADFAYGATGAWPGRAGGNGSTLEVVDTTRDYNDPGNWQSSIEYNGTPGQASAGSSVVVNEVLANTDQPLVDWIELYNTTAASVDISGWWLSDTNADYFKFQIPAGTVIDPHGYLVLREGHYAGNVMEFALNEFGGGAKGFGLNGAHGDDVWLVQTAAAGNVARFADHAEFGAAAAGESYGRWQDDQGKWHLYPMRQRTEGARNDAAGNGPHVGPLVITEIMYAPKPSSSTAALSPTEVSAGFTSLDQMEYLEIYNPGESAVDLTNWRLDGTVSYAFATGTSLPARSTMLVVSFNPTVTAMLTAFRASARYRFGATVKVVGPYTGHLTDTGGQVELLRPDAPPLNEPTFYPGLLEDEVIYMPSRGANGDGRSLCRQSTTAWGLNQSSWTAGSTTAGAFGQVVGRYAFYNNSSFDGSSDDAAIANDKSPLMPGQQASFQNYTSYSRGMNGVMVDIAGLVSTSLGVSDFDFKVGNTSNLGAWTAAPTPSVGVSSLSPGVYRVMFTWADNAIQNQWLQVTVKATPTKTPLPTDDVFYFGNAIAETGNHVTDPGANAEVDESDEAAVRAAQAGGLPAPLTSPYDFNRDRRVNATDELIARANRRAGGDALHWINLEGGAMAASALASTDTADSPAVVSKLLEAAPASAASQVFTLPPAPLPKIRPVGTSGPTRQEPTSVSHPQKNKSQAHDIVLQSLGMVRPLDAFAWLWDFETARWHRPAKKATGLSATAENLPALLR